jgi:sec-independent protein translocase protein TatB
MLDIGWTEMLVIAVVALLVIGPKDMPAAFRTFARLLRKARGVAREFQSAVDDVVREAELEEVRSEFRSATDVRGKLRSTLDPDGSMSKTLSDLNHPMGGTGGPKKPGNAIGRKPPADVGAPVQPAGGEAAPASAAVPPPAPPPPETISAQPVPAPVAADAAKPSGAVAGDPPATRS